MVRHSKSGETEARKNPKGFSREWRGLEKQTHLVRWKSICMDKDKGGLVLEVSLL